MTTKDIMSGEWSDVINLGFAGETLEGDELIDPAHVADKAGNRYLCMSKNYLYPLSEDGLQITGPAVHICEDWPVPDSWEIEGVYTEGPKFTYRNGWYYLMVAEGGTVGPPVSHGVIAFRARDIKGPWESSPYNPIVHTDSREETWWSQGHASFVDTPDGEWYILFHGILNGYRELGRMTLMLPIEWTDDGWFRVPEGVHTGDALPMPKGGKNITHGYPLTDDFSQGMLSGAWVKYVGRKLEQPKCETWLGTGWLGYDEFAKKVSFSDNGLRLETTGTSLHDTDVLLYNAGFKAFEIVTELELCNAGAGGGISMYYGPSHCCGISLKDSKIQAYDSTKPLLVKPFNLREYMGNRIFFKLLYRNHVVSPWYSSNGENWTKLNICADVSMFCMHLFIPGVVWIRPALFAFGEGSVIFKKIEVTPLEDIQ